MTTIKFKGNPIETSGTIPSVGSLAPNFTLTRTDLSDLNLAAIGNKYKILNIFPSLDTGVCAASVRTFHQKLAKMSDVTLLNISKDLPFAHNRFCQAEHLNSAEHLSAFRSSFAKDYGLEMRTGPLAGLCSRVVIVLDGQNRVVYTEQVPEITQEPDYAKALQALEKQTANRR